MVEEVKTTLKEIKEYFMEEMQNRGDIMVFLIAALATLILWPLGVLYLLLIKPIYKSIRIIIDAPKLGFKKAYQKHIHPDEYEEEQTVKKQEDKPLIHEGRLKQFRDQEYWPGAYVVDGVAVCSAEGRTLVYVDENVEEFDVPEGVANIHHYCFACCEKLKKVSLPPSLKRIGKRAFFGCVSLKEIVIPESVYMIGEEMLMDCASLEHVVLSSQIIEIPTRLFCNCRSLQVFSLSEQVKSIDVEAFRRCYLLERIELNEQLETIGERAFEDCRSLKEFIMPESLKFINPGLFNGCHSLEHIHFSSHINDFGGSLCRECWNIKKISMTPMDEKTKEWYKKQWDDYADEVDIKKSENPFPKSVFWTMGDTLYFGIPRLTSVCLVLCFSKEKEFSIPSFVTNVKQEAFSSCKNLRTLCLSPFIKAGDSPWGTSCVTYSFIYDHWPQVENVIFDKTLKNTKYAFGLLG